MLKAVAIVLTRHLAPRLSKQCTLLAGNGGGRPFADVLAGLVAREEPETDGDAGVEEELGGQRRRHSLGTGPQTEPLARCAVQCLCGMIVSGRAVD